MKIRSLNFGVIKLCIPMEIKKTDNGRVRLNYPHQKTFKHTSLILFMEMDQESELLHNFEKDSEWFHKNIDLLRKRGFTEKFVAVKRGDVISSDKDINNLIKSLEKKDENPSYVFVEFVYPKGSIVIL